MSPRLDERELASELVALPEWERRGETLVRAFRCDGFAGSMRFVNAIAELAERLDHHPDIGIVWDVVTLTLRSHDVGAITMRDVRLARAVDAAIAIAPHGSADSNESPDGDARE